MLTTTTDYTVKTYTITTSLRRCDNFESFKSSTYSYLQIIQSCPIIVRIYHQPRSGMVMQDCRWKKNKESYGFGLIVYEIQNRSSHSHGTALYMT